MTLTKEWLQHQIAEFESCAERTDGYRLDEGGKNTLAALKLALAGMEAEPVAWIVGGIATNDKKWAVRRSEEDNLLMEPLYIHPIITGIDENHYDPELEPGLYVAEIMTNGGAAIINGYYTAPQPLTTSERAELENYRNAQVVPDVMDDAGGVCCEVSYADGWNACRAAALQGESVNTSSIPNGWKLVPIDPTKDMLRAGQSVVGFWLNTVHCYSKMLAAAPAAPQQGVDYR